MRLLIITQKVDKKASDLGFFHGWLKEFAKNFEEITVVCLQKGEFDLQKSVKVVSLGKERRESKFGYVRNFFSIIIKERKNYDAVFVHMNQIYVVLGGFLWRLWGKPVFLWYVHKNVSLSLRVAEKFVTKIFTASKESFRLSSKKVFIVGHGIDTEVFKLSPNNNTNGVIFLVTLGRISPVKNIELMVDVSTEIKKLGWESRLTIIGDPGTYDQTSYLRRLEEKVKDENLDEDIKFIPGVPHEKLPELLKDKDIFLNFSNTGSIDKAVLEAYFSGLKVLTTNEAFKDFSNTITYTDKTDKKELALEAIKMYDSPSKTNTHEFSTMKERFSLQNLIQNISRLITNHE